MNNKTIYDHLFWLAFGWAPCLVVGAFCLSSILFVVGLFSYAFGGDFMLVDDDMLGRLFAASGILLYLILLVARFTVKPHQTQE